MSKRFASLLSVFGLYLVASIAGAQGLQCSGVNAAIGNINPDSVAVQLTATCSGGAIAQYNWTFTPTGSATFSATTPTGTQPATVNATGTFTVQACDASNICSNTASSNTIYVVRLAPGLNQALFQLPPGQPGQPYPPQTIQASGGPGPYNFTVTVGQLPQGLQLAPTTGIISGTLATSATTQTFTVRATDTSTGPSFGTYGERQYQISVASPPTLSITPATLPAATATVAYSQPLAGVGGTGPYTFAVASGNTGGLTLTSAGLLSGTPPVAGTFEFVVRITDARTFTSTQNFRLNVSTVAPPNQVITPQAAAAITAPTTQLNNVQQRLDNLRTMSNPTVTSGLRASYGGQAIPISAVALAPTEEERKHAQSGGGASADGESQWGVYVQGSIDVGKVSQFNTQPGFDLRTNGVTLGADYRFGGNTIVGAALGFLKTKTDLNDSGGNQDTKGYSLSLYSEFVPMPNAYIDLALNFGRNDYTGTRNDNNDPSNPAQYSSDTDGSQFGVAATIGYQFYKDALTLIPYGRVEYVKAKIDAFQEGGNGGNALSVGSQSYSSTVFSLGGQAQYAISTTWGVVVPYLRGEWQYQSQTSSDLVTVYLINDPTVTGSGSALLVDKNYGNVAAGVTIVTPRGLSGYFNWQHLFGKDNFSSDQYTLGIRYNF